MKQLGVYQKKQSEGQVTSLINKEKLHVTNSDLLPLSLPSILSIVLTLSLLTLPTNHSNIMSGLRKHSVKGKFTIFKSDYLGL